MSKRYTIGIDFGTLSARAVALDLETGIWKNIISLPAAHFFV